jgi:predicted dehydrogenase
MQNSDAACGWRADRSLADAGVVVDQGAHTIDLARWLVGDIERVSGQLTTQITERPIPDGEQRRQVTTDDKHSALAEFENGAVSVFQGSRIATGREADNSISVHGSEGDTRIHPPTIK